MSLLTISARVGAVSPSPPSASRRSAALIAARIGLPALPPSGGVSSLGHGHLQLLVDLVADGSVADGSDVSGTARYGSSSGNVLF